MDLRLGRPVGDDLVGLETDALRQVDYRNQIGGVCDLEIAGKFIVAQTDLRRRCYPEVSVSGGPASRPR